MADHKKRGIDFFRQGLGCAQAIMCAYAEELAISYEEAIRMSEEYAAGTYRVCGPVMAMHVILNGLLNREYPQTPYELTGAAKEPGEKMDKAFEKRFGSLTCQELRTENASGKDLICIQVISEVIKLLDAFLAENKILGIEE